MTFSHCQTFFGGICDFKQDFHTGSHSGDNITLPSLFCLFADTQQIFHTANPLSVISSHCQTSFCCFWEFVQKQPSHNHNSAFYDVQTRFLPFKASTLTKKLFLEANEFFSQLRAPHVFSRFSAGFAAKSRRLIINTAISDTMDNVSRFSCQANAVTPPDPSHFARLRGCMCLESGFGQDQGLAGLWRRRTFSWKQEATEISITLV